jgi:pyridoxamine 5'-phosphate oxidase
VDSHHIPHVRSQIHRGFIFPKSAPNLPLLVTSSDVRAPKVTQMFSNTSVEICWWMEGSQDQFRISGKATVVPPPDNALHNLMPSSNSLALSELNSSGEAERDDGSECRLLGKYDWEKKRKEVFEGMKPAMKASWLTPKAPGSQMSSYDEPNTWRTEIPSFNELKTEEEKANYAFALDNFAMIVIEPLKIDWVQLGEHPNRRTLFTRKDESGGSIWVEDILVP